ncbi:MAG: hypothetical protein WA151_23360 [Desulfatirhabdiaceae bacterium]
MTNVSAQAIVAMRESPGSRFTGKGTVQTSEVIEQLQKIFNKKENISCTSEDVPDIPTPI